MTPTPSPTPIPSPIPTPSPTFKWGSGKVYKGVSLNCFGNKNSALG